MAVITNIGAEHLEGLGDLAGVRRENAFITAGLSPCGTLVVNGDDKPLLEEVAGYPGERVTFGFDPSNDLFAADVRCDESGVRFTLNGRQRGRSCRCSAGTSRATRWRRSPSGRRWG